MTVRIGMSRRGRNRSRKKRSAVFNIAEVCATRGTPGDVQQPCVVAEPLRRP